MRRSIGRAAVVSVIAASVLSPVVAHSASTLTILPNLGVGPARLGQPRTTAVTYLKRYTPLAASGRDARYVGQTVYYYYFGRRLGNGRFPLEVYAKPLYGTTRVFIFQINSAQVGASPCLTAKGIKVGSTESALRRAYGSALRRRAGSAGWVVYSMGSGASTDFWVRYGKVQKILIRRY